MIENCKTQPAAITFEQDPRQPAERLETAVGELDFAKIANHLVSKFSNHNVDLSDHIPPCLPFGIFTLVWILNEWKIDLTVYMEIW